MRTWAEEIQFFNELVKDSTVRAYFRSKGITLWAGVVDSYRLNRWEYSNVKLWFTVRLKRGNFSDNKDEIIEYCRQRLHAKEEPDDDPEGLGSLTA